MLSPVSTVSALGTALEKPVVATAETSGVQTAATPLAVLSSTVNASVEGKLNMLLVAARERMFDSLLSPSTTLSVALNVSRGPDESNAALAQRLGRYDPQLAATAACRGPATAGYAGKDADPFASHCRGSGQSGWPGSGTNCHQPGGGTDTGA